jgi:hypothetical protein
MTMLRAVLLGAACAAVMAAPPPRRASSRRATTYEEWSYDRCARGAVGGVRHGPAQRTGIR